MNGFLLMVEAVYADSKGKLIPVSFFSENPQEPSVHFAAFGMLNFIVKYAGNLGSLMRRNEVDATRKCELLRSGVEIFNGDLSLYDHLVGENPKGTNYERLIKDIPNMGAREDLIQFYKLLTGK